MGLPFTLEQFLDVFARYNQQVWPVQLVLIALALTAVHLALRPGPGGGWAVATILALLWGWTAVAYHWSFFTRVNPAAYAFGGVFMLQAALLLFAGDLRALWFQPRRDAAGIAGWVLVAYALVGYPLVGWLAGHRYPAAPTFGVPCPTTIFTLGVLLGLQGRPARRLFVIPVLWAAAATVAALQLGMTEDLGLPAAALAAVVLVMRKRGAVRSSPGPRAASVEPEPAHG
ncbi:MAG TPA: DUF6064 family protein [Longimicrobium sp.]|nr:DUF6064 family protein [Longimicrobium sp.]